MNEREIERLLKSYGDSVPPCTVPAFQRRPLQWPRFAAAGIATIAVAGIAVIGLWPRDAVAGSVARLHRALSDAKTMEYTVSMKIPSGWHPVLRAYYEGGVWRYETRLGTSLEYTAVRRDGMQLIDYKTMDHASLDTAPAPDPSDKWQTALDFAKEGIDTGNVEIKRSLKVHDHDPVNGRPAYEITMERPSDHYLAKILVDRQSDLPISSSVVTDDQRPGFGDVPQQIRTEFQFNRPLDPQIFRLDPKNRVVIRMGDARDRLKKMWQTPIASVAGADVRAATVTRDGTIWIAITASGDRPMLPTSLTDASGTRYVRGGDLAPGSQLDNKSFDDAFSKPIYVTAFAPLPGSGWKPMSDGTRVYDLGTVVVSDKKGFLKVLSGGSESHQKIDPVRVAHARAMVSATGKAWQSAMAGGSDLEQVILERPLTTRFIRRDPSFVSPGRLLDRETDRSEVVTIVPTHESGDLPNYFPMLGLDRPNMRLTQSIWRAKAEALESNQQYLLAAQAYGQAAKARYDWVKYSAYQPMLDEARCYRAVGQTEQAAALVQQAEALKASRER